VWDDTILLEVRHHFRGNI
jgi:cell division cycle protein 20 (cofactor of APC complex)